MKNKIKIIFLSLFAIIIFFSQNTFAYNIKYLGKYVDPTNLSSDATT